MTAQQTFDNARARLTEVVEYDGSPRIRFDLPPLSTYACIGIRLIDDAVLIRLEKPERWHAKAKLWIPDSAKREDWEVYHGVVIACGPGRRHAKRGTLIPMELKPGEHVQFYWGAGEMDLTELFGEEGAEYRIISEKSVQAVLYD